MTTQQIEELQAQIARMYEITSFYAPAYMQAEVAALWMDICALIGVETEAVALAAARECQAGLPAEFWSPV
jgi:hypothetical protein